MATSAGGLTIQGGYIVRVWVNFAPGSGDLKKVTGESWELSDSTKPDREFHLVSFVVDDDAGRLGRVNFLLFGQFVPENIRLRMKGEKDWVSLGEVPYK